MKKLIRTLSLAVAALTLFSVSASAASIVTEDDFSSSKSKKNWTVDNAEPEDFDISKGVLYLAVGDNGYRKNRPDDQKDKSYALQGYKLACDEVSGSSWTATVKIKIDDAWFGERADSYVKKETNEGRGQRVLDNKKKATLRVDLTDGSDSPSIALIKGGDGAPLFKFYSPDEPQSWGAADIQLEQAKAVNPKSVKNAKDTTSVSPKEWYTMVIACKSGKITYSIDNQKIGSYTLSSSSAEPTDLALSMQNFERPDVSVWDDIRLYSGVYTYSEDE